MNEIAMTPGKIIGLTADAYGITTRELLSKTREHAYAHPRQLAMLAMRERLGMKYQAISAWTNVGCHTTVVHGVKAAAVRRDTCPETAGRYEFINEQLDFMIIPDGLDGPTPQQRLDGTVVRRE